MTSTVILCGYGWSQLQWQLVWHHLNHHVGWLGSYWAARLISLHDFKHYVVRSWITSTAALVTNDLNLHADEFHSSSVIMVLGSRWSYPAQQGDLHCPSDCLMISTTLLTSPGQPQLLFWLVINNSNLHVDHSRTSTSITADPGPPQLPCWLKVNILNLYFS